MKTLLFNFSILCRVSEQFIEEYVSRLDIRRALRYFYVIKILQSNVQEVFLASCRFLLKYFSVFITNKQKNFLSFSLEVFQEVQVLGMSNKCI